MSSSLTSDTKLESIKSNLQEFYNYILNTNNISSIYNITRINIKEYIRNTLIKVNNISYKSVILRKRREEVRDDIRDLERAFIGSEWHEPSEEGKNTGGKKDDSVMLRKIKIRELKDTLEDLTNQTLLLEKSFIHNKEMVSNAFDFILNEEDSKIMKLYYLDCMSSRDIAIENFYTTDAVVKKRKRAVNKITNTIIDLFQNQ